MSHVRHLVRPPPFAARKATGYGYFSQSMHIGNFPSYFVTHQSVARATFLADVTVARATSHQGRGHQECLLGVVWARHGREREFHT